MLHLEIRQENGQYRAYSVDHSPNAPVDAVVLPETDKWEKVFDGEGIEGRYSLTLEQGKWRIKAGTPDLGGNSEESTIEIGTLFSEDDNILGIVIALFNAAPGQELLETFSNMASNGRTEPQLANFLAAHPVFTNAIMGGKSTAEQVTELMNHFGLVADGVQGSAASMAQTFFTQSIASNVGYGAIAAQATFYLLSNPLLGNKVIKQFSSTSLLFKLKIFVADNYSANNPSTDLATLQAVLAGITLKIGTDNSDILEGSPSGSVIEGGLAGDTIILEIAQNARDILLLNDVRDSQILDINGDGFVRIREDGNNLVLEERALNEARQFSVSAANTSDGIKVPNLMSDVDNNNSFFDVITNFSGGAADTDDLIDISSFNFTGTQAGLVDVSARVSIDDSLDSVPDLFRDEVGDRGVAFFKFSNGSNSTTTFVFIDANKDGDFTATEDMFLALLGVDDLIDANFRFTVGSVDGPATDTFTLTVGADNLIGTDADNLFLAPIVQNNVANGVNTLENSDIVNGGAGTDTLTATLSNADAAPLLLNIENINARFEDARTLNLDFVEGIDQIIVEQSTAAGTVSSIGNVDTLGVENQNLDVTFSGNTSTLQNLKFDTVGASLEIVDQVLVNLDDGATTVNITTNDANIELATLASAEILSIAATGDNRIHFATTQDKITDIIITGTGFVDLFDTSFTVVETIDGSASTGGLAVCACASSAFTHFIGSSADDDFIGSVHGSTISAGGGQDFITLDGFEFVDTLIFAAGDSVLSTDTHGHDIISDFGTTAGGGALDIIDLGAFGFTGQQASALNNKGALADSAVDGSTLFVLDFYSSGGVDRGAAIGTNNGDTYVFVDVNKDGDFNAADDVFIQILAVTDLTLANFGF